MQMKLDTQRRAERVEVLPDQRLRVTQTYDVIDWVIRNGEVQFDADILLPWGTAHATYPNCRLTKQDTTGQIENPFLKPNAPPPQLVRVWEEIPANDRVIVGNPGISYNQYGFKEIAITYIQFSAGTTVYTDTVGTSTAPAPNSDAVLKTVEGANDGTLRTYRLTYTTGGEMSDAEELKFGGKLKIRTLTYLNQVPPTPSGYTLVTTSIEYVNGLPLYRYGFVAGGGGGGTGTGGEISREYSVVQNGTAALNTVTPTSNTGAVRCVITYLTDASVTADPITAPASFVLVSLDRQLEDGYCKWVGVYAYGTGLVVDETQISQSGVLVIYHRVALGSAPATPSATIGGTVTLFDSSQRNDTGYVVYDYRWAEGNGQASITTDGQADGALIYTVVDTDAAAATPAYPGSGTAYLVRLKQDAQNGYFLNTAVYHKPPADTTYRKTIEFEEPGIAEFAGSPPQFELRPPKQRTLLADVEVTYATTQDTTAPFDIEAYATFTESFIPETNPTGGQSIPQQSQKGLGGYLAGASGISGTNSVYNGVLCREWEAQLISSIPSTFPTGSLTLKVENDPYLTATDGTKVYRRTVISYTF